MSLKDILQGVISARDGISEYGDKKQSYDKQQVENALKQAQIDSIQGKPGVENQKNLQKTSSAIGDLAKLKNQFDQYASLLEDTVTVKGSIGKHIRGSQSQEKFAEAQTMLPNIIGALAKYDHLPQTQGMIELLKNKMDVSNPAELKGLVSGINSQLSNMVVSEGHKAGLNRNQSFQVFDQAYSNQFGSINTTAENNDQEHHQEEPVSSVFQKTPEQQKQKDSIGDALADTYEDLRNATVGVGSGLGTTLKKVLKAITPNIESTFDNPEKAKKIWENPEQYYKRLYNSGYGNVADALKNSQSFDEWQSIIRKNLTGEGPSKPHERIDSAASKINEKFIEKTGANTESPAFKGGDFIGEEGSKLAAALATGGTSLAGSVGSGAALEVLEHPESPLKAAAIGSAKALATHGVFSALSKIPQHLKKWWLKWGKQAKSSENTIETAERLANYFPGDEVSLGQVLGSPSMIQRERAMGHAPFSGYGKSVDKMISDLEKTSENIAAKYQKNPSGVMQQILENEEKAVKTGKKAYIDALGKSPDDLPLDPLTANNLINSKYKYKPDLKHSAEGRITPTNSEIQKTWNEYKDALSSLYETNPTQYEAVYKKLNLPSFWDVHWYSSDLKGVKRGLARSGKDLESNIKKQLTNDQKITEDIFKNYSKSKEYQAARELWRDTVAPYRSKDMLDLKFKFGQGEPVSFSKFKNAGNSEKKVFDSLSKENKNALLADVLDPSAEKLSLRSFKEEFGKRGNKSTKKSAQLITPEERQTFEDYGQLNRMLTDLQPQQKDPNTGKTIIRAMKNPAFYLTTAGAAKVNPYLTIPSVYANRKLGQSLRNKKNLRYFTDKKLQESISKANKSRLTKISAVSTNRLKRERDE